MAGNEYTVVEEIFSDYNGRRTGLMKAFTIEKSQFMQRTNPENGELWLVGQPDERWEVMPLAELVLDPPDLPKPLSPINTRRSQMSEEEWFNLAAKQSDAWLFAVAFYQKYQTLGVTTQDRRKLFDLMNNLPTITEAIMGDDIQPCNNPSSTINEIFLDVSGRRAGLAKPLSTEFKDFYQQCGSGEDLWLIGLPNKQWAVRTTDQVEPAYLPSPPRVFDRARERMTPNEWLNETSIQSDVWLQNVALYHAAEHHLKSDDRIQLFQMINKFPTLSTVIKDIDITSLLPSDTSSDSSFKGNSESQGEDSNPAQSDDMTDSNSKGSSESQGEDSNLARSEDMADSNSKGGSESQGEHSNPAESDDMEASNSKGTSESHGEDSNPAQSDDMEDSNSKGSSKSPGEDSSAADSDSKSNSISQETSMSLDEHSSGTESFGSMEENPLCHWCSERLDRTNPENYMIECVRCKKWYHGKCVVGTYDEFRLRGLDCPDCL